MEYYTVRFEGYVIVGAESAENAEAFARSQLDNLASEYEITDVEG
jgi:hypothetical protein